MAVTLNASTSSGLVQTADTSGTVQIQSNGTTKLTVSSSGVNIGQMNGGAITSGTAVASTSGTSIDFTSIPSWVKTITVMFNGVSVSGTSNLLIQIGTSSGVEATGYLSGASNYVAYTSFTTGFGAVRNNSAGSIWAGAVVLTNITGNAWVSSGNLDDSSAGAQLMNSAGSKTLSATLDRVRITTVNGTDTFDAGTLNILYEG